MSGARRSLPVAATALALAAGGCQVVREVGKDTVRLVDTVATVDTLVHVDTVTVRDTLWSLGDALAAGAMSDLAAPAAPELAPPPAESAAAGATTAAPSSTASSAAAPRDTSAPVVSAADTAELHRRGLLVPVAGVSADKLFDSFDELRGSRRHQALDILAPRGTAVLSADAGKVTKLYTSAGGGTTIYAQDPTGRYIYYYAHLDRYDPRTREGLALNRGDTLGYVGSTGNASPDAPHLHFAVVRINDPRQWWRGTPIDPKPLFQ